MAHGKRTTRGAAPGAPPGGFVFGEVPQLPGADFGGPFRDIAEAAGGFARGLREEQEKEAEKAFKKAREELEKRRVEELEAAGKARRKVLEEDREKERLDKKRRQDARARLATIDPERFGPKAFVADPTATLDEILEQQEQIDALLGVDFTPEEARARVLAGVSPDKPAKPLRLTPAQRLGAQQQAALRAGRAAADNLINTVLPTIVDADGNPDPGNLSRDEQVTFVANRIKAAVPGLSDADARAFAIQSLNDVADENRQAARATGGGFNLFDEPGGTGAPPPAAAPPQGGESAEDIARRIRGR